MFNQEITEACVAARSSGSEFEKGVGADDSQKFHTFFNGGEVRAIRDDTQVKWYFHVIDIVSILNEQPVYARAGIYWPWLKSKLRRENSQLVSAAHGFDFKIRNGGGY